MANVKILKVKNWLFHQIILLKFDEYFLLSKTDSLNKKIILDKYIKMAANDEIPTSLEQLIEDIDWAIRNEIKYYNKIIS